MGTPPCNGSKKRILNARSTSSSAPASVMAGSANTIMNDIVRMPQQKRGKRLSDMPGARRRRMVTMKLTPPMVVATPRKVTPIAQ